MQEKVSIEQLDEVRLLADQLETKLQQLRNQEAEYDELSFTNDVLFRAASDAKVLKLRIAAALLNLKQETNEH